MKTDRIYFAAKKSETVEDKTPEIESGVIFQSLKEVNKEVSRPTRVTRETMEFSPITKKSADGKVEQTNQMFMLGIASDLGLDPSEDKTEDSYPLWLAVDDLKGSSQRIMIFKRTGARYAGASKELECVRYTPVIISSAKDPKMFRNINKADFFAAGTNFKEKQAILDFQLIIFNE